MNKRMTFKQALLTLMEAASNDVRGAGLGMRATSDAWRDRVAAAWGIAHKRAYGREAGDSEYRNAGMQPPARQKT